MKNKKLLLSLASLATVAGTVVSLAGCAGNGSLTTEEFAIPEDFDVDTFLDTPITITFYSTMGQDLKKVFDEGAVADFNTLFPNITIEHTSVGSYDDVRDQIATEISVGNAPNLAYCYPDHVALYNGANAVATLDDLINDTTYKDKNGNLLFGLSEAEKSDFIQGFWDEGKSFGDGKMYTLPFSKSTEILYYNKTVFDELDLDVPTTWDEMEQVCDTLKKAYPDSTPLGYDSDANWFITMCEQMGIPYTDASAETLEGKFLFNNDQAKGFLADIADWSTKGWVTTQGKYGNYTSGLFISTTTTRSFMTIGSSAGASHQVPKKGSDGQYPFDVGVAPIPQANVNNKKVISQGPDICIFKNKDPNKVLASWLFLKFITTDVASQGEFGIASGYLPVIKSVAENPAYQQHMQGEGNDSLTAMAAKLCNDMAEYYFTSDAFEGSSDARDQVGNALTAVVNNTKTIDQALKDAFDECIYKNSN